MLRKFRIEIAEDLDTSLKSEEQLLLVALVSGERAGIADDANGSSCVYCNWQSENYRAAPKHWAPCPIFRARKFLWPRP